MKTIYTHTLAFSCLFLLAIQLHAQSALTINTQVTPASCNGICNGSIDLTVTGGTPQYWYIWSSGATTQDMSGLCAGTYTVTVVDAAGISQTTSAVVTQSPAMVLTTCVTAVLCNGSSSGAIDLTVTGGTPAYSYLWTNGATPQDLTNLVAGTYTPTVTDANGCTKTTSATVTQPTAMAVVAAVTNSSSGNNNGAIDLTVSGGSAPYTFNWSNGVNIPDVSGLTPGAYTVTVTDSHGCTKTNSVTVQGGGGSGPAPLQINGNVTNSTCGSACTGSIGLTITGGQSPYTFTWSGPAITPFTSHLQNLSDVCAGPYCVIVTDAAGITASQCFIILQNQTQIIDIQSSNAAFCNYDPTGNSAVCEMVCPHTTVSYFFDPPLVCGQPLTLYGITWKITGAESYKINPNKKEVVVVWGEAGAGLVKLSSSDTSALCFESSHCVTILEEPEAKFSTDPPATNNTLQLCKGQTVSFHNESLNATQYEWQFSDDISVLSEENPHHTFRIPGNFTVTLIARSNCLCADTTILEVEVLNTEPPLLDCVGSVCPGETVTYTTSSNCSSYAWVVSPNGTVVNGGTASDATITIQWEEGPAGSISLSASGCGGATCPQASIFTIPIISDNAEIKGNEFVCPDTEEEYSIDLFDGTSYTWTLASGGSILSGQGTNKIKVAWTVKPNANTMHWLSVQYDNCYLGCGGQDSIPVKVLSPFLLQGPVEICPKSTASFNAMLITPAFGITCNWTVYRENGTVFATSASTSASYAFPANAPAGKYRIVAEPAGAGQTCSINAELVVNVAPQPPKPAAIIGPNVICPSTPLSYEVPGGGPFSVKWTAGNGAPTAQTGNPVNVIWSAASTHWIAAAYVSTDGLGCVSDTTRLNITNVSAMLVTGPITACPGTIGAYSASFYEKFDYQWEIIPASAGVIKSGQGRNNAEIFWQTPGTHKVRVTSCSISTELTVTVWSNPQPVVTQPAGLCPGISDVVMTTIPYAAYLWQTASGTPVSTTATPSVASGTYAVQVTDNHGCKSSTEFKINTYPTPNVSLTTTDPTGFCNNEIFVSMVALVPDDGVFTYAWQQDGLPVSAPDAPGYATNQYGDYTVIVTNEYNCKATSLPLHLFEYCGGGGGGYCTNPSKPPCPPGSVHIIADVSARCDSVLLTFQESTGQYVTGSASWWTGVSGGNLVGIATGDNISFVYPNAGKYIVILQIQVQSGGSCEVIDSVAIEAAAQFSQRLACPGDSTIFIDESTRLPDADITNWHWDFGEAGSADTSIHASPKHPFANAGNYMATLTVTAASGCKSTYSENVFVPDLPEPEFAPPVANCTGSATAFSLVNPTGILQTHWDFGHPVSGALNQSSGNPVYHNYSLASNYPVAMTATNTYGCAATVTQPVAIVPNPFSGNITPASTVICEGSSITLTAPAGPSASYVWSDGTNLSTLDVTREGIYDVTVTDASGCSYSPPYKSVEVNPAPIGVIKALTVSDLGQVIGVSYNTLSVCAGEDVTLQVQDNGTFTYQWNGITGSTDLLVFSEERGNLLSVGTHIYTVTVTNPSTGCTTVLAPFAVNVHPVPTGFSITTDNVCAGTPSVISYNGPQPPEWQLFWNTGDTGPTLTTQTEGLYFVRVVNEFGCSAQSNTAVIFPGPNITALPSGCHERCNPDTLCLPVLPEIVSWQWYFGGSAIAGATSNQFVATQSGTYYAALTDIHGCAAQSADLTVALYDGVGTILGQVWSDVNDNGIVDASDTLVSSIPVQLLQNGTQINVNQSNANGDFNWLDIPAAGYVVQIDSQLLDPLWVIVVPSDSVNLSGCGGKVFADLLVKPFTCPTVFSNVTLSVCPGDTVYYNNMALLAGQTQLFSFSALLGCDSIVTVTVVTLPISAFTLNVQVCFGTTFQYQGVELAIGQTQDFTFANFAGCDSVVTVVVSALPVSSSTVQAKTCPGTTFQYQGVELAIGQTQDFTFANFAGCDSVVTVVVSALPVSSSTVQAKTCPGTTFQYQGLELAIGQTQDFMLVNTAGCDSVVTVSVTALTASVSAISLGVCPGETLTYQNVALTAGQIQDFILTNFQGCDSIVTVTVFEKNTSLETRSVVVCPDETYTFNGITVLPGQSKDFHFTNAEQCDSTIIITVATSPALDFSITGETSCPNAPTGALSITVAPGSSNPTGFSLDNIDFQDDSSFINVATGVHTVFVRDENGCVFEKQTIVGASQPLEVVLHNAFVIPCDSTLITLTPSISGDTSGLQMIWSNGAQIASFTTAQAGAVWLDATNHCGDVVHREATVDWADATGAPVNIYMPNIFAPAAKNPANSMFRPFFGSNLTLLQYRMEVYDRWGNLVFETDQPELGWEGPFRKKMTDPGVFVWQMWAKVAFCGREVALYKKGDVTVER